MAEHESAIDAGVGPWRSSDPPAGFAPFPDAAVDGSVTDRFLEVAERFASRVAISSPAGTWTYAELRRDVLAIAAAVGEQVGTAEPAPVAVVADHDGPLVAAILGIIASGHIVVVLDPQAPAAQTDHVLAECSPPLVLVDANHADWATERLTGRRTQPLGALLGAAADPATGAPRPPCTPRSPLMLAFTSGTSGASKAAVITHGVVLNLVRGATNALGIGPDDRMPMLFPTSLAVASYPMFLPLLNGGTLATLDVRSVGLAPVADFLASERITLAYLAPTVVRFLVDALAGHHFDDLRMIALGGELVDHEVFRLTDDLFQPTWLANGYGTTETGVVTLWVVDAASQRAAERDGAVGADSAVPVGFAVPQVEIAILDDHGDPVPAGVAGEIAVASPHLFDGYWQHPELNGRVLFPDVSGRDGWRMYRTGDYGRLDDRGALVVLGRLDTRVKVRGRPVVLGDVEASVQQLDAVADAVVVAHTRDHLVELVAFVVPAGDVALDATALRAQLLEGNETYRVPSRWVVLDELPRLPNGKVDRRGLAAADPLDPAAVGAGTVSRVLGAGDGDADADGARGASVDASAGDRVGVERGLRDIWERLLPGQTIGLDDDFVHLGGDSLMAAEMVLIVERELHATIPMGELVHARTIRSLTDVVLRLRRGPDRTTVSCVNRGDEPARPRLWFVHDLQGSAYRVRHLAEALGEDQPVWSFESPLLRGEPNHFTTLDTFAARYLTDLRAAQPEGPYWLAGYSFGGICAYEMARQLREDGEEVAFVGVVDVGPGYRGPGWHGTRSPFRPWFSVAKPPDPGATVKEKAEHYVRMVRQSPRRAARHLMVRTGVARLVDPLRFRNDLRKHGQVRQGWRLWYAWEEHWKIAARGWDRSSTYPGRVHLFWGSESASADATMGWGPLVGELVIERFPGDHLGILEPRGAHALAKVLRDAIDHELHTSEPTGSRGGPP